MAETETKEPESALLKKLAKEISGFADKGQIITKWPKSVIPSKVPPGFAVISDPDGAGMMVVELALISGAGPSTLVRPIFGQERGAIQCGARIPDLSHNQIICHQYTPYPEIREDDGEYHVVNMKDGGPGVLQYPHMWPKAKPRWQEHKGTHYFKNSVQAMEMLASVKAEEKAADDKVAAEKEALKLAAMKVKP